MTKQNILLVEPGYPNKYPPLGLMKIAAYHGPRGRGDNVLFVKGDTREVLGQVWDRVYVTTLFSFEWKRTAAAIDFALRVMMNIHKELPLSFPGCPPSPDPSPPFTQISRHYP